MALTPARAGLARSGATRSGYPILQGVRVALYALSGVARSGATRSNYHSPKSFISVNGVQRGASHVGSAGILLDSLTVTDTLNDVANTATCRARGFTPVEGQEFIVTLGSQNNGERQFAGRILRSTQSYLLKPANPVHDLSLIDYTWGLNTRKVTGHYTGTLTAIAQAVFTEYAPAGYTLQVEADLPLLTGGITFTMQDLTDALSQMTARGDADWVCDYQRVVHVFSATPPGTRPTNLNAVNPVLRSFSASRDLSQFITRVYVEGGGSTVLETVAPGETIIPVATAQWYQASGGVVLCGPQRITYTGLALGAGGSLVGPGAAPAAAPFVTLASGAGIESGLHYYAVIFRTASGPSIAGPLVAITVGLAAAPSSAPVAAAPTIGTGPSPGTHDYATTYVTSSGETTPSDLVTVATTLTPAPATAPTPGTPTAGSGPDAGPHEYAVSFTTAIGETIPGPISASVTTGVTAAPVSAPVPGAPLVGSGVDTGVHLYAVTNVTAAGETTTSPISVSVSTGPVTNAAAPVIVSNGPNATLADLDNGDTYDYACAYSVASSSSDHSAETQIVAVATMIAQDSLDDGTGVRTSETVLDVLMSDHPSVRWVHVYRRNRTDDGSDVGDFRLLVTESNVTHVGAFPVHDVVSDASIAGNYAPVVANTAVVNIVPLTGIPIGPAGTTSRKLYRTAAGGSQQKLLTTIANNFTTTYTDSTADASLGANIPTTSTALMQVVPLTGIPIGDANVTSRKVYRRSGGLGLKLLTTIANNTATTHTDTTANASLGAASLTVSTAYLQRIPLTLTPPTSPLVTSVNIYGTASGGSQLKLIANVAASTTAYTVVLIDASLGANVPVSNTATANQVALSAIPLGPPATTSREVYRTPIGSAQLKLAITIADNTTTTATDSGADASLGANVPTSDTSGLTQPQGMVLAGSPTLPMAGAGTMPTSGWAVIGNGTQVIRYTGITDNSLTGIPASGVGSITATIGYNSNITAAATLTGIPDSGTGAIRYSLTKGADINLFVQVDDVAAQAAFAALVGGDGIKEDYLQDRRLAHAEATARGTAHLALRNQVNVAISYVTHDLNTRAGQTVSVNLGTPTNVTGEFLIQQVTLTDFQPGTPGQTDPRTQPTRTVEASNDRFSFEDVLRLLKAKA